MKKVLFGYKRGGSFGSYLNKDKIIEVYEEGDKFFVEYTPGSRDKDLKYYKAEMSEKIIDEIKNVYLERAEVFEIEEVEFPPILDGSSHRFAFSDNKHSVDLYASNIWYYANDYEGERAVNAKLVLTVYSEVAEILLEAGVDKKMLML